MPFYFFEREIGLHRETLRLFITSAFIRVKESETSYTSYISRKLQIPPSSQMNKEIISPSTDYFSLDATNVLKVFQLSEKSLCWEELSFIS